MYVRVWSLCVRVSLYYVKYFGSVRYWIDKQPRESDFEKNVLNMIVSSKRCILYVIIMCVAGINKSI